MMGILNTTPDSFSDGGQFLLLDQALTHARQMIADGAEILDIGGESTRPGAAAVSIDEEINRVLPVIEALRLESDIPLSIDTSKASVMSEAARAGVDLINDVRALREPGALEAARETALPVCLMHMQGEPRTMQENPQYQDLLGDIADFFSERISACEAAGLDRHRLILDIGFGFGKTPVHNLKLINRLASFQSFDLPLLVGLSRKSTIGQLVSNRMIGSVAGALVAADHGANILRVHDVRETVEAVRVWYAIRTERLANE